MTREYITKDVAAKRSGKSVRRLLELAAAGRIRKQILQDPKNGNRALTVFNAGDIAQLAKPSTTALQISGPMRPPVAALPQPVASVIPPTQRLWLNLAEAADYSGLPASFLVQRIDAKKLPALDVGVRPGGRWRIAKRDLEGITAG